MAKFNSTTFGEISGRHGSAVAATRKDGTCILKVYRTPSNPNTAKQQVQRSKFGFVNSELTCMRDLFKITFNSKMGKNQGVSLAMANAVTGESPDWSIDYSRLILSVGSRNQTGAVSVTQTEGTGVKLTWDTTNGYQGGADDRVNVVFLNATSKIGILEQSLATRADGVAELELPAIWEGSEVHCWIYFDSASGGDPSTSQYISLLQL